MKKNPIAEARDRTGCLMAGVLFYRMQHWHQFHVTEVDDLDWVVMTLNAWSADSCLSADQVRQALIALESEGMILTQFAGPVENPLIWIAVLEDGT